MNLKDNLFYLENHFVCNECAITMETMEIVILGGNQSSNFVDYMDKKVLNGNHGKNPQVSGG